MTCPSCGSANISAGRFCPFCGMPVADQDAPTIATAVEGAVRSVSGPMHAAHTPISVGEPLDGRFAPGTVLVDRYRIVGLCVRK